MTPCEAENGGPSGGSSDAEVFIGLDLGTSSLKGVAVTAGGEVAARGHAPYHTTRDAPGQAEQDPGNWLRALRRVVRQMQAAAPPRRWRAIGLSAMIPTLVTVDASGAPTGPAVTWEDARAEAQGDAYRAAAGEALCATAGAFLKAEQSRAGIPGDGPSALYKQTGQWVDGRYLLPMWMRLREAESSRVAVATRLLSAKDYLFWWLTGEYATDPSTATGFGCFRLTGGAWAAAAAAAAGVSSADGVLETAGRPGRPGLPAVLPSKATRPLTVAAAKSLGLPAGLPVCLGAADSVLGALALGAAHSGDVAYITGTSSVILGVSADFTPESEHRCLVTPLATGAGWGLEMDLLSTGSAVDWLARLLRFGTGGAAKLMELVASVDIAAASVASAGSTVTAPGVRFYPYLGGGEQGALWDPDLRGTIVGLDLAQGPADLVSALVDGIVCESRRCLEVLEQNGVPPAPLRIAGAGASSPVFRRRLADACGREVLFAADTERPYSAIGAALVAARATGSPPADPQSWTGPLEATRPDADARAWWDARYSAHLAEAEGVRRLYHKS